MEIDCYGTLKEYALAPELLKEKMKALEWSDPDVVKDLAKRGLALRQSTADMKGGTAVLLCELFKAAKEDFRPELNILYVGVGDEETAAEGIFQSVGLFTELKDKYGLDYMLLINGELTTKDSRKNIHIMTVP